MQPFPAAVERTTGGTVKAQILHYNIAAQKGTWLAHELMDKELNKRVGWFVCHADIDPQTEVDRILRVSGSPYEPDSGSQWHDEKTVAEGVLPINRYDWGWYDSRCRNEVPELDDPRSPVWEGESLGLVDYGHAKEYIDKWKHTRPLQRENKPHGIWMDIQLEYMFGRFGFNDEHTAARSFLWFTTNTDFTRTVFAGTQQTLRVFESPADRFERQLREQYNFDGVALITKMAGWHREHTRMPNQSDLLGPYDKADYILNAADVDDILAPVIAAPASASTRLTRFIEQWKDASIETINEIIMSYLEKFIAPASSAHDTIIEAATALFPKHETVNSLDGRLYGRMTKLNLYPSKLDRVAIAKKIKKFLTPRCGDNSLIRNDLFVEGLVGCVAYLVDEVLELASNCRDEGQNGLLPVLIRISVLWDDDLLELLRFSRVYWHGGEYGWVGVDDAAAERQER
jgi:hypothetical protein